MPLQKDDFISAADYIHQFITDTPTVGLVLGSGLGVLADELVNSVTIPYKDIPNWPQSTVVGHSGELVIGELEGVNVICQRGRAHFYEGYTMDQVTFPIRVMAFLGVQTFILTNAAGGLDPSYKAGDLMLLNDHINLLGMVGNNPLMGKNDETLGPRFVGMTQTYDRQLRLKAQAVAEAHGIPLHEGVYVCLSGPTYETPAEVRFLRTIGANAVGMSTVPEVLVARHMGLRVLAISSITNEAIAETDTDLLVNHEEVLEMGRVIVPRLATVIKGVLGDSR